MLDINIEQMEELGIADYYLDISKFIHNFVNRNYPLTQKDMTAISIGETTENIQYRNDIFELLTNELSLFLTKKSEENLQFLEALKNGDNIKAQPLEEYKKEVFEFEQFLLEVLWNYRKGQSSKLNK